MLSCVQSFAQAVEEAGGGEALEGLTRAEQLDGDCGWRRPPDMQQLLGSLYGDQAAMGDFASVIAGTLSPVDLFSAATAPAAT